MSLAVDGTIEQNESFCDFFEELADNLFSHWQGRRIEIEDAMILNEALQYKLLQLLCSQNLNTPSIENFLSQFSLPNDTSSAFALANRDIKPLFVTLDKLYDQNELMMQVGLGKFWQKHKKKIIVGVVALAIATTVLALSVITNGAGSEAAVAAGAAAIDKAQKSEKKDSKEKTSDSEETLVEEQDTKTFSDQPFHYNEPLFVKEGVFLKDQYYTYSDFLKKTNQEKFLADLLNAPKVLPSEKLPSEISKNPDYQPLPPQPGVSLTRKFFETFGREVLGHDFMSDVPPSEIQKSHIFTTEGQRSPSCRIGGINGLGTSLDSAVDHANYIKKLTSGNSIDWVYNNSHGPLADLFLEVPLNYNGISPNTTQLLTDNWVAFHNENKNNPKARYLQFCHSQGALHVKNALEKAPQEIRERVMVIAIAPAAIVPREICFDSVNYASKKDIVPLGEMLFAGFNEPEIRREQLQLALENRKELILLEPHPEAKGIDHDFQSPTFYKTIDDTIKDYVKQKGNYD